jgi:cellobiose transport system permease protein
MLAPFVVLFAVFDVVPLAGTMWMSGWDWSPLGTSRWVGLDNYARVVGDERFWRAATNTVGILVIATLPQIALGIVLAHAINAMPPGPANLVRVSLLVPFVTSSAAVAIVVSQVVDPDFGLLTRALEGVGAGGLDALATPLGAWSVVAGMVVWRWFGFTALIYATLLQAVPADVYRAAELDGAGVWSQLRHITLPALRPGILFTVVTSIAGVVQLFTEPLLLDADSATCGPARQCQTVALLIYQVGFREYRFGYAAAIATVAFAAVGAALGLGALAARRRREAAR